MVTTAIIRRGFARALIGISTALGLATCSEHAVDTFPEWCEQLAGVNLEEKYAPFWAVLFSVRIDGDAIRDDFVRFLNDAYMQKVDDRAPRMVWREITDLHIVNLSSFFEVEAVEFIDEWKSGIAAASQYTSKDDADRCLYGTVSSIFDSLYIHSMESDSLGQNWTDAVSVISTKRRERLGDKAL